MNTNNTVKRTYPLRFVLQTDAEKVAEVLNKWNESLSVIPGKGYFDFRPHYETINGRPVECYYMYSDETFWDHWIGRTASIGPVVDEEIVMSGGIELQSA
jgi:hypothetical protein